MKSIVNGKTYNTETADQLCNLPCSSNRGDFGYHDTKLYRTKKGAFFLAGCGGARSMWAESVSNGSIGGSGIRPVSEAEAREHMESADCEEEDFIAAGLPVDEA